MFKAELLPRCMARVAQTPLRHPPCSLQHCLAPAPPCACAAPPAVALHARCPRPSACFVHAPPRHCAPPNQARQCQPHGPGCPAAASRSMIPSVPASFALLGHAPLCSSVSKEDSSINNGRAGPASPLEWWIYSTQSHRCWLERLSCAPRFERQQLLTGKSQLLG